MVLGLQQGLAPLGASASSASAGAAASAEERLDALEAHPGVACPSWGCWASWGASCPCQGSVPCHPIIPSSQVEECLCPSCPSWAWRHPWGLQWASRPCLPWHRQRPLACPCPSYPSSAGPSWAAGGLRPCQRQTSPCHQQGRRPSCHPCLPCRRTSNPFPFRRRPCHPCLPCRPAASIARGGAPDGPPSSLQANIQWFTLDHLEVHLGHRLRGLFGRAVAHKAESSALTVGILHRRDGRDGTIRCEHLLQCRVVDALVQVLYVQIDSLRTAGSSLAGCAARNAFARSAFVSALP